MRILVYGAGVIGSLFAGKLMEAGADVTLLARNNRLKSLAQHGIILNNIMTKERRTYHPKLIDHLSPGDTYDYIIVCVLYKHVGTILPVLKENRSKNVVFVSNTPDGYDHWIAEIGAERILLGFPAAAGELIGDEVNYLINTGTVRLFQATTFAELNGTKTQRLKNLLHLFKRAGFAPVITKDMDAWQKTHVAVLLAITGAINQHNGDNYALAQSPASLKHMIQELRKMLELIKKKNIQLQPKGINALYLPMSILTPVFKSMLGSKLGEYGMAKYAVSGKEELLQLEKAFYQVMTSE